MRDREINERSDATQLRSYESAAREIVHDGADDRVRRDSFEKRRAAGHDGHADDQDGPDYGDDLLDALLARPDVGDVFADPRTAVRAYAPALDDQVTSALGAFDFGSERHRSYEEDATRSGIRWQVGLCSRLVRC